VACGHDRQRGLDRYEDHGAAYGADPSQVSGRAIDRRRSAFSRQRIGGTFVPLAPPGATVQVEAFVR
jgi:hypothetical protein